MVFGLVASDGKTIPPLFVRQGLKITAEVYREEILTKVMDWLEENYGPAWSRKVVLQQDGATPHTANSTQDFLRQRFGEDGFWAKDK